MIESILKNKLNINLDLALLILRFGLGVMFILHGYPKIQGGIKTWTWLGGNGMGAFGINIFPVFWGFMAAFAEFFGGIMILLGLYTRLFALLLFFTMVTASAYHFSNGDSIFPSHAVELSIVFLSLFFSGGGNYTIKKIIPSSNSINE